MRRLLACSACLTLAACFNSPASSGSSSGTSAGLGSTSGSSASSSTFGTSSSGGSSGSSGSSGSTGNVCGACPMFACSSACVDVTSDTENCGACGNRCFDGCETVPCVNGACVYNPGGCFTAGANTGGAAGATGSGTTGSGTIGSSTTGSSTTGGRFSCDHDCASNADCASGFTCTLPSFTFGSTTGSGSGGELCTRCYGNICNGVCYGDDPNHCGSCDNVCGAYQTCYGGRCTCNLQGTCPGLCTCGPGQAACGADCAVLASDPNHCGTCDTVCTSGVCQNSQCVDPDADAGPVLFAADQLIGLAPDVGSARVADLDGDGKLDVVASINDDAFQSDGGVVVLLGHGDGTFAAAQVTHVNAGADLSVADIDGDGKLDVVVVDAWVPAFTVLYGDGNGGFAKEDQVSQSPSVYVDARDFNGDGHPDLLLQDYNSGDLALRLGFGDGGFGAPQTLPANGDFSTWGEQRPYQIADVNEDGLPDVVSSTVMLAQANGSFTVAATFAQPVLSGVGDLNGDGHLDVLMFSSDDLAGACAPNALVVYLGRGDGSFTAGGSLALPFPMIIGRPTVAIGDFDGDGHADVAVDVDSAVLVYSGDGAGNFTALPRSYPVGYDAHVILPFDVNGDGKLDLVIATAQAGDVELLLGQ